jgi:hypothetical protein
MTNEEIKKDYLLLQGKVLQFYQKLREEKDPYIYTVDLIEQYKNHFGIQTHRVGALKKNS